MHPDIQHFYEESYHKPLLKNDKPLYYYFKAEQSGNGIFMVASNIQSLRILGGHNLTGDDLNLPDRISPDYDGLIYMFERRFFDEKEMLRRIKLKAFL